MHQDPQVLRLRARAGRAYRHDVKAGALLMIRPRSGWRIHRALFGMSLGPLPDDVDYLIGMASRRVARMRAAGLISHWSYEQSRHVAAMQALLALRYLRRQGFASLERSPVSEREAA